MIAENVHDILDQIAEAADRSGRARSDITLVGVTKTRTASEVDEVIRAGIAHCGENRLQEAAAKLPGVHGKAVWHMLGHLQSNKAAKAAALFDWIDSVDSAKLAGILSTQAVELDTTLAILIQVNISGEEAKSGVTPAEVREVVLRAQHLPGIDVRGLMTIGSLGASGSTMRDEFRRMRDLFEDLRADVTTTSSMRELSMGMSGDFAQAIEAGSTMVRIGTALFGPRRA